VDRHWAYAAKFFGDVARQGKLLRIDRSLVKPPCRDGPTGAESHNYLYRPCRIASLCASCPGGSCVQRYCYRHPTPLIADARPLPRFGLRRLPHLPVRRRSPVLISCPSYCPEMLCTAWPSEAARSPCGNRQSPGPCGPRSHEAPAPCIRPRRATLELRPQFWDAPLTLASP